MSYNTALSGLNASQADLNVISHNVANASTVGFKGSRAEFGDIFSRSAFGTSSTAIGSGVLLTNVAQQFHQGNLSFTENSLDLAISGEGMFVMTPELSSDERIYTRAGQFGVDADGYVVNSANQYLQVFPTNEDGTVQSTALTSAQPLRLPASAGTPAATSEVELGMNLPPDKDSLNPLSFDPTRSETYTSSTSLTVYDSLGTAHIATVYFVKSDGSNADNELTSLMVAAGLSEADATTALTAINNGTDAIDAIQSFGDPDPTYSNEIATVAAQSISDAQNGANTWAAYYYVDGKPVPVSGGIENNNIMLADAVTPMQYGMLSFDNNGEMRSDAPSRMQTLPIPVGNGASDMEITFDFANNKPTQYAETPFSVTALDQNGYASGRLSGMNINDTGEIRANYSNGQSIAIGKVAMVDFPNPQGLEQLGNANWAETVDAGTPIAGEAGTSSFGLLKSGALENSNVDITAELVKLITAQRNFQANSKALETSNTLTQTIINLR